MRPGGIDDPIAKAMEQFEGRGGGRPEVDLVLSVGGAFAPLSSVLSALKSFYSGAGASERTRVLLQALADAIRDVEAKVEDLEPRLASPAFLEGLIAAVNESVRTASTERIRRLGQVLGRVALDGDDLEEAAAYVHDLARLTEADIRALRILYEHLNDLTSRTPVMTGPDPYTERMQSVLRGVSSAGLAPDEFYARCARLSGFGLAIEVQRNPARMKPEDHCFRLTGRGNRLYELLRGRAP